MTARPACEKTAGSRHQPTDDLRANESRFGWRKAGMIRRGWSAGDRADSAGVKLAWSARMAARTTLEIAVAFVGSALLLSAMVADQNWLDRHFLPSWFLPRHGYVLIETCVRILIAAFGGWLALFARQIGRAHV